jgi:hypothetical protein
VRRSAGERVRRQPERTVLYRAVQAGWDSFVLGVAAAGRSVPRFCQRKAAAFMRCRILAHGLARVQCEDCGQDDVVALVHRMTCEPAREGEAVVWR